MFSISDCCPMLIILCANVALVWSLDLYLALFSGPLCLVIVRCLLYVFVSWCLMVEILLFLYMQLRGQKQSYSTADCYKTACTHMQGAWCLIVYNITMKPNFCTTIILEPYEVCCCWSLTEIGPYNEAFLDLHTILVPYIRRFVVDC